MDLSSCCIFKAIIFHIFWATFASSLKCILKCQFFYKVESGTSKSSGLVEEIRLYEHSGLFSLQMSSFSEIPEMTKVVFTSPKTGQKIANYELDIFSPCIDNGEKKVGFRTIHLTLFRKASISTLTVKNSRVTISNVSIYVVEIHIYICSL